MFFRTPIFLLVAAVTTASAGNLNAQNDSASPTEITAFSSWYVTTTAGEKILSQSLNVTAKGWLLNRGDDVKRLSPSAVFSVMNTAARTPELPVDETLSRLYLSNGDRLIGRLTTLSEDGLELRPLAVSSEQRSVTPGPDQTTKDAEGGAPDVLKIPIESVRALEWIPPSTSLAQLQPLKLQHDVNQDVLMLSNGDQLSGELTTLSSTSLEFLGDQGARTLPTGEVRAILFNPELLNEPPPLTEYSRIALSDGSLLTLTKLTLLDYNRFELTAALAGKYQVPLDMLVSVSSYSTTRVPLSSRAPSSVEYTPFLTTIPPWQPDRSVQGTPMIMTGGRYLTGLGVHSRTAMSWTLEEGDLRFLADIGIDDSTSGGGSVTFTVLLDDAVAFESGVVGGGELPRTIDIDLKGKQTITLLVGFGNQGDVLDRADWGHAVIVTE